MMKDIKPLQIVELIITSQHQHCESKNSNYKSSRVSKEMKFLPHVTSSCILTVISKDTC